MKRLIVAAVAVTCAATPIVIGGAGANADTARSDGATEYVVLYAEGASLASARAAITSAGGTIVSENTDVGVATVHDDQRRVRRPPPTPARPSTGPPRTGSSASVPDDGRRPPERCRSSTRPRPRSPAPAAQRCQPPRRRPRQAAEPLADLQWDMQQIGATADGSYRYEQGTGRARSASSTPASTGRIPTSPRTSTLADSRNFTVDIPVDAERRRDRRPVRGRARPVVQRSRRRRRGRPRHARRVDDRRADQRHRHRRRGPAGDDRQPARRPGLRATSSCSRRSTR